MSEGVRQTQCTTCMHRSICKYKDLYLKVVEAVQKVTVDSVPITELDFLSQPIELRCKYCQTTTITCRGIS